MGSGKKDSYETEFMGGDDALFREKHVSRIFAGLMALPALAGVAGAVSLALDPNGGLLFALIPLMSGAAIASAGLFFSVMRTVVTNEHVTVQYGMLGPTIDVAAITDCEVVTLAAASRLMFGAKIWPEGWRYIPPGAKSGVRIRFRGARGETTCTIGATDAAGLAAAIREARGRTASTSGVRVDAALEQEYEERVETAAEGKKRANERVRSAS